jgi:hypothetical protein
MSFFPLGVDTEIRRTSVLVGDVPYQSGRTRTEMDETVHLEDLGIVIFRARVALASRPRTSPAKWTAVSGSRLPPARYPATVRL